MNDFTCPSCGWPQGPVASGGLSCLGCDRPARPGSNYCDKCWERWGNEPRPPLAAPQDYSHCVGSIFLSFLPDPLTPDIAGLVERLRGQYAGEYGLMEEAADALERLQHLYSQTRAFLGVANDELAAAKAALEETERAMNAFDAAALAYRGERDAAKAEIERLEHLRAEAGYHSQKFREALEKVDRKVTKAIEGDNPEIFQGLIEDCQTIARAALTGRGE